MRYLLMCLDISIHESVFMGIYLRDSDSTRIATHLLTWDIGINTNTADYSTALTLRTIVNIISRTFLPTALAHHRKACTEERPMIKSKVE